MAMLAGEPAARGSGAGLVRPSSCVAEELLAFAETAASCDSECALSSGAVRAARNIPVGRMGTPAEFGAMAAFLASPLAGYITGTMIRLDGGSVRGI